MRSISEIVRSRAFLLGVAAIVVIGGAIVFFIAGSGEPEAVAAPTTTTTTTSTTLAPTTTTTILDTTTTIDEANRSPINGTYVEDIELLDRRVLAVKMDNHPNARPQSGVDQADMVIELMVEGITRFITIWHHSDAEYMGPVRSGRPTDQTILTAFNEPTFVISGAQGWVQSMIRDVGIHLIGEVHPETFRINSRRAPHNLYANTILLRDHAESLGYPDEPPVGSLWEFGPVPAEADAAEAIRMDFEGNIVNWDWDDETGTWLRTMSGTESEWENEDGETGRIGFPVIVALYVERYSVGGLPSSRTAGSDQPAFIFADGKVVEARWERDDIYEWFTLTDGNGEVIPVPEGQVWVALVPENSGLTYE